MINRWINTYIPILSEELIKYLQSPLPFIMGIDKNMLDLGYEYLQEEENIFIIFINLNVIDKFTNQKKKVGRKSLMYLN